MATVALACYLLFGVLAFGWRTFVQLRRTGDTGWRGLSGRPGSAEWWGGVLFASAIALGFAATALALTETVEPIAALNGAVAHVLGLVLFAAGLGGTLGAQLAMGVAWRIGVDERERTELVIGGPFA